MSTKSGFPVLDVSTPRVIAGLLIPTCALLSAVALQPWVPVADLVRDPLVVAQDATECCSFYFGAISNLGVIAWFVTATACLLLAALLRLAGAEPDPLFLAGGLLSLWLGLDDLFLVHENLLPAAGFPELVTYAIYASAGLAYLAFAWRRILAGRPLLFLLAGAALGGSMLLDAIVYRPDAFWTFLEDALKFIGIVLWAGFHVLAALTAAALLVRQTHAQAVSPERAASSGAVTAR